MTTTNDATLEEGVPADENVAQQATSTDRPRSPRDLAMEAIAAQSNRQRAEELGLSLDAAEEETDAEELSESGETSVNEKQIQAQLSDEVINDPAGRKVRVKVDGQELEVPLEDVLRNYQKGSAADRRLEEATRLLNEAKQQTMRSPEQAAPETGDASPGQSSVQSPEGVETHIKTALSAIYEGDHTAAEKAFARAFEQSKGGVSPTQALGEAEYAAIASRVQQQVQQQIEVDTALATIKSDYPKIISSPDVELLTAIKVNSKMAAGATRPAAMLEAAQEVYASLGLEKSGRQDDTQGESRNEKLMRKADRDRVPSAKATAPTAAAGLPDTPSSTIAAIAAGRMGQTMNLVRAER